MYPEEQIAPDNYDDTAKQRPERPVKYVYWMDDDAATMSLLGCLGELFVPLIWLTFYTGHRVTFDDLSTQSGAKLVSMTIAASIALLASVYFFGIKKHPLGWKAVGIKFVAPLWVLVSFILGISFLPVSVFISDAISKIMIDSGMDLEAAAETFDTFPTWEFIAVFISVAIIVPIAEEIFFRGVLYNWLRYRHSLMTGLIVSSLLFGAIHFAFASMISLSLVGMLCALVYERSGSIWPAVAVHAGNNGAVVLYFYFVLSARVTM